MPTFDPSLCSVDDARLICDVGDSSQDELLRQLVLAATGLVQAGPEEFALRPNLKSRIYSDTDVNAASPAIVLDGKGRRYLDVPYWPVTAVAKVELLTDELAGTWTAVDLATNPCGIDAQVPGRIFFRSQVFYCGYQNVRMSMTAGYSPVPEELRQATKLIVLGLYKQPELQRTGILSQTFPGGQSVTYDRSLIPDAAVRLLAGYRGFAV